MTSTRAPGLGWTVPVLAAAGVGWLITVDRMEGMDAGPGTELGGLGWFVGVWVVMMAAMMLPSTLPMVATYARIRAAPLGTAIFVVGYLLVWTVVGLVAYAVVEEARSLDIGFLAWDDAGRFVAAGVLLAAALYEFTPLKDACLGKCRDPLPSLREAWRPGSLGALQMGIAHGRWCVGSSWALMAALFALGVMSVGWMVLIGALVAAEKLLPWKVLATRGVTAVLIVLAIGVAVAPESVPGLTVPDSSEAAPSMDAMGMQAR